MECHNQCFDSACEELSLGEKLPLMAIRIPLKILRIFSKAKSRYYLGDEAAVPDSESLNLKEGDRVRVKPLDEIRKTLNKDHKYQGLSFFTPMEKFCGRTFTVRKKVRQVFNERRWRMTKIKNVVLLEGVFCDGIGGIDKTWHGCDRCCYIWWKEAWLERAPENENK